MLHELCGLCCVGCYRGLSLLHLAVDVDVLCIDSRFGRVVCIGIVIIVEERVIVTLVGLALLLQYRIECLTAIRFRLGCVRHLAQYISIVPDVIKDRHRFLA